jgi:hypothetical protein
MLRQAYDYRPVGTQLDTKGNSDGGWATNIRPRDLEVIHSI